MKPQHLVEKFSRCRRRLGNPIKISDVLPSLFKDLGTVNVSRSLMPCD